MRLFSKPLNPETIGALPTWQECAARCQAKAACLFWDWRDERHETPNTCVLNEGFHKSVDNYFGVAGSRDCKGQINAFNLCV